MKRAFALALAFTAALTAGPALADLLVRSTDRESFVRLQNTPCPAMMTRYIPQAIIQSFHAGLYKVDNEQGVLCWAEVGEAYWVIMDDGSRGQMMKEAFDEEPGV